MLPAIAMQPLPLHKQALQAAPILSEPRFAAATAFPVFLLLYHACPFAVLAAIIAGPDASGFCYRLLSGGSGGFSYASATSACRALGGDSQLASIVDASTQAALVGPNGRCYGQATNTYWIGLIALATGTTSKTSTNWQHLASGMQSTFVTSPAVANSGIWDTNQPGASGDGCYVQAVIHAHHGVSMLHVSALVCHRPLLVLQMPELDSKQLSSPTLSALAAISTCR